MTNGEAFGFGTQAVFVAVAIISALGSGSDLDGPDSEEPDASWLDQMPPSAKGMFWGFAVYILCIVINYTIDALM